MRKLLYILFIISAVSCEERVEWPLDDQLSPRLVVEGMITNNPELNYTKLSLPVKNPADTASSISGATVLLVSEDGSQQLVESEPGYYTPDTDIIGVVGKGYRLYININGSEFLSGVVWMTPVSPMKEFRHYEISTLPGYHAINPREEDEPSFTEYRVIFENPEVPGDTLHSKFYTFTLRSIDVNQFFKPNAEWLIFPETSRVIRTKYSLTPDYERYFRSLLSETEWKGGWFDVLPGNLHTNLSQGAVGYFGACTTVRDTVYFK